jgi:class 3 adenylate cyclase/WD40 repeat protein
MSALLPAEPGTGSLPSGTVTFLFTDIEGSTRLLEQLRGDFASLLSDQRDLLRASFAYWGGIEVDTQGDAFFAAFPRAADAVACAVDAQGRLAGHKWARDAQVRVRMGLHTGEPMIARTGYIGMDVHRAARIAAAGHGGQILISSVTRDLLDDVLPDGAALVDLGEHRLKDVRGPIHLYQISVPGSPHEFPALRTMATGDEPPTAGEAPFMGLHAFDAADASRFFGREELTARLVERVDAERFLAIVGASGSGKSSLVRAGLVPALDAAGAGWRTTILTPTERPIEALALALPAGPGSVGATASLMDDLRGDPRSLHLAAVRLIEGGGRRRQGRLLLVVDQFEELYTICRDARDREAFIACLLTATNTAGGPVHVVITLRADFYGHLASQEELRQIVATKQEYIGPMSPGELRRAIEAPATNGGWEFVPGLVDLILRDVGDEPGALPLLSHALLETWQRRRGAIMTLKAYGESGGVQGAIARTADRVMQAELDTEQRTIARGIFLRLTELGEGTQDTRRRVALSEILPADPAAAEAVRGVLLLLADRRLITVAEATVEVAHEALIREWPTLREWLDEDRDGLRTHRHLTEATEEWLLLERDDGALYRGLRLTQADEWARADAGTLNAQEREFLEASRAYAVRDEAAREEGRSRELRAAEQLAAAEKQRAEDAARAAQGMRRRALLLSGAMVVAGALAVAAIYFGLQADSQRTATEAARTEALSRQLVAQSIATRDDLAPSILLSILGLQRFDSIQARINFLDALGTQPEIVRLIPGPPVGGKAIAVRPDGGMAAVETNTGIQLWDLASGVQVGEPIAGKIPTFSPDGRSLAFFDDRAIAVAVLDLATKTRRLAPTTSDPDQVVTLGWTDAGASVRWLTTDIQAGVLSTWEPATNRHSDLVVPPGVELAPDATHFLLYSRFPYQLWDASTGLPVGSPIDGDPRFSEDGKYLAVLTDATIDPGPTRASIYRIDGFVRLGPEFRLFDSTSETRETLGDVHVAVAPDEGRAAVLATGSGTLSLWDLVSGTPVYSSLTPSGFQTLAIGASSTAGTIVAGNADGTLEVIDFARTSRLVLGHLPTLPVQAGLATVGRVAISRDGMLVGIADSAGVELRDVATGEVRATVPLPGPSLWAMAIGADDHGLFLGEGPSLGSCTLVYRPVDPPGAPAQTLPGSAPCSSGLAVSPDGNVVAIPGKTTVLVDRALASARTVAVDADLAAFLPGSGLVLVKSGNPTSDDIGGPTVLGAVRIVDGSTGKVPADVPFDGLATALDASPDGSLIAVAITDGGGEIERSSLVLVDVGLRAVVGTIDAGPGRILALRFEVANGGRTALTVTSDGSVRRWDLDPKSWLATACRLVGRNLSLAEWTRYMGAEPYVEACPGAPVPNEP